MQDGIYVAHTVKCEGERLRLEAVGGLVIEADAWDVLEAIRKASLNRLFARNGGRVRSEKKAAAARVNGRKGGRPKIRINTDHDV